MLVQADVLDLSPRLLKEHHLPAAFAAILLDVFARLNNGQPMPFTVIDRGVRVCRDGWPCEGGKLASGLCTRCAPWVDAQGDKIPEGQP